MGLMVEASLEAHLAVPRAPDGHSDSPTYAQLNDWSCPRGRYQSKVAFTQPLARAVGHPSNALPLARVSVNGASIDHSYARSAPPRE